MQTEVMRTTIYFRKRKDAIGRICCHFLSTKEEKASPDIEYLIGHELLPVRRGRTDPRKVKPQSMISFLYRVA